eukprot:5369495-Amphidinium_carterae.1
METCSVVGQLVIPAFHVEWYEEAKTLYHMISLTNDKCVKAQRYAHASPKVHLIRQNKAEIQPKLWPQTV